MIDLSGDSSWNPLGPPIATARDAVLGAGIVINGLAILCREPCSGRPRFENLEAEYADKIIGGPGAFVVTADGRAELRAGGAAQADPRDRRPRRSVAPRRREAVEYGSAPSGAGGGDAARLLLILALALPARGAGARAGRPGAPAARRRDELDRRGGARDPAARLCGGAGRSGGARRRSGRRRPRADRGRLRRVGGPAAAGRGGRLDGDRRRRDGAGLRRRASWRRRGGCRA